MRRIPREFVALLALLATMIALMWQPMREETATFDEPLFLAAGRTYLKGMGWHIDPEQPQLAKAGGLARARVPLDADPEDSFRSVLPSFDFVFTYGGGDPVVRDYRAMGARDCVPIYNAFDPDTHFPVPAENRFVADLTFLGNRLPDRELRVTEFFFRAAEAIPNRSFLLGGSGWGDRSMPANVRYLGHVYTCDHNTLNASCRAVLNISRESMARYGFSPATRVFEAAAAGACVITDFWEGLELFLRPGAEVLSASSGREVAAILESLTQERARSIGDAARRRVAILESLPLWRPPEHRRPAIADLLAGFPGLGRARFLSHDAGVRPGRRG